MRTQDVLPVALGARMVNVLREHADEIGQGALLVLDEAIERLRLLPIRARG